MQHFSTEFEREVMDHKWIGQYILDEDGRPVPEPDLLTWAAWMESTDRHLAMDILPGGVRVSTIFLGLDQHFLFGSVPMLWETMIFGGEHHLYQERYTSKQAAVEGHARALAFARAA
jgi:hypothetical protein